MADVNNYISLADAAEQSPYTQEYLSLRARQGKLRAVKQGRNWVTTQAWLDEYINQVDEAKHELKEVMVKKAAAPVSAASPALADYSEVPSAPSWPMQEGVHQEAVQEEEASQPTNQYAHYRPYNEVPKEVAPTVAPAAPETSVVAEPVAAQQTVEIPIHHDTKAALTGIEHHPVAERRPSLPRHDIQSKLSMDDISPTGSDFVWEEESTHQHITPYEAPEIEEVPSELLYNPIAVADISSYNDSPTYAPEVVEEVIGESVYDPMPASAQTSYQNYDHPVIEPSWSIGDQGVEDQEETVEDDEKVGKTVLNSLVITACALFFFMAVTIFDAPLGISKNIATGYTDVTSNIHSGLIAVGVAPDDALPQLATIPVNTQRNVVDASGTVAGAQIEKPTFAQNIAAGVVTLISGQTSSGYTGNAVADWLIDVYDLP
jgi:hypothetical protein